MIKWLSFHRVDMTLMLGLFMICLQMNILSFPSVYREMPATLTHNGWTVVADDSRKVLSISHDSLGIILNNVRINIRNDEELMVVEDWKAEVTEGKLILKTVKPVMALIFSIDGENIMISCTSYSLVITADAPATTGRVVARLLDHRGFPVTWMGTDENVVSFGGTETRNPSFLPSSNADVMTFALGQVSGSLLHSLFDRNKNIAIDFPASTRMDRDPDNPDILHICMPVAGNARIKIIPEYYTKVLGLPFYSRFDDSVFPTAPIVWCSWTAYYNQAREADIMRNTDWISANLKPYGFRYVQIDDGYDDDVEGLKHHWIDHWDKRGYYPHGPKWIADYIKSKGLHPGLWLVPNVYAGAVEKHPDWYLRDGSGKFILDYSTPSLDCTNPGVQDWLKKLFTTLKDWGFEYYKFDGEFALPLYAPQVDRSKIYDQSVDPMIAYRNRLKIIRDVIGPGTFIEGCQAGTPLNGTGFFNSSFCGADVYNSWQGSYALFSSINANAFLNHMVIYVMPGEGIDISPFMTLEEARSKMVPRFIEVTASREDPVAGYGTTLQEARTLVSYVSLTGTVYPIASIMPGLPEERTRLLKMTMPTLPILPVDLFSRGTDMTWDKFKFTTTDTYIHNYPEIIDLKVNAQAGTYDVVALTNWRSEPLRKKVSFSGNLGLESGVPYVIFDFWEQKLAGIFRDEVEIIIEPHDTKILQVHPLLDRPQLIGNSRHISGSYSILKLDWDRTAMNLKGLSETVPGDSYALFIYVPDGISIMGASASAGEKHEIPVSKEQYGNMLKLAFRGQAVPVAWKISFKQESR